MSEEFHNPNVRVSLNVLPTPAQERALAAMKEVEAASAKASASEAAHTAVEVPSVNSTDQKILTPLEKKLLEGQIIKACRQIYDPEIPVSIYELGLIYAIEIADNAAVKVKMTLTAPACPVAGSLPG